MARILIVESTPAEGRRLIAQLRSVGHEAVLAQEGAAAFLARILILSAETDPRAVAAALDSGADDLLSKDCSLSELLAHIHAALRRPPAAAPDDVLEVGPIRLEKLNVRVLVDNRPLKLAPAEFRLIAYFMAHAGRVLPRRQLLEEVWPRHKNPGERTVDVHVRRLRAALEPYACDQLLQTVRGHGYRFGEATTVPGPLRRTAMSPSRN